MDNFPLGNFSENTESLEKTTPSKSMEVNFDAFNDSKFFEIVQSINSLQEEQINNLIKTYIDLIVDKTLSDDPRMGEILCNPRFVASYYKVIQTIPIDQQRRYFCNKMSYEYSIIDNPDPHILNTFREVSKYVNNESAQKLINRGLNPYIANDLCVSRFSSRHESTNIQRLNFTICKYNAEIFTDQMIVWVYEILFDRISELFISSMLEVYTDRELDELGGDFRDIYSNISLAILVILNNMPSAAIRQIILTYIDEYKEWVKTRLTIPRFTLRSLSYDYSRIIEVVDKLLLEGVDVP